MEAYTYPVVLFSVLLLLNFVRWLLLRSKSGFAQQQRARLSLEIQALRRQAEVGWLRRQHQGQRQHGCV